MRVSKSHPVANWLRCDANLYSRSLDRVLRDRDEALKTDRQHSGLPAESKRWFWEEQLPNLMQQEQYRHQVEQHAENLQLALVAIDSDINRQTQSLQEERAAKAAELAQVNALLA